MNFLSTLIKKRDGLQLSAAEIAEAVKGIVLSEVADYQTSALLMAMFLRGMTEQETLALTLSMRDSGETVDLSDLNFEGTPSLDKHSTGGVGDKTTLVVVPLLAAGGVPMLKMSGRGLGHTGGTIDKLASIPGFRTELTVLEAKAQTRKIGAALIAQSDSLVPADKILYALRDATGTIESVPLIASSIMSKKLASGAARILLDVKVGRGAFVESQAEAEKLARVMIRIGNGAGVPTGAVLTSMDEPLGKMIGNALEVKEALHVLTNRVEVEPRFRELCLILASHGFVATGKAKDETEGLQMATALLTSGKAAEKFAEISAAQGGPDTIEKIVASLPNAAVQHPIYADTEGFLHEMDAKVLGLLAMRVGAGRERKEDTIDFAVGIELCGKCGVKIANGELLAILHLTKNDTENRLPELEKAFRDALTIKPTPLLDERPLILLTL